MMNAAQQQGSAVNQPSQTLAFIRPWHWAMPLLVLALTAPLWLGQFEPAAFYFFNRHLSALPDIVWSLLSLFGTGWAVFAATSPALWRAPRIVLAWLCAAPLAGIVTRVGKMAANNARPLEVLDPTTIHVIGEPLFIAAMPSGHTLTAFAAASAIYFALAPQRRWRFAALFVCALGVGLSRMAVGAHWPADVSVGAALGLFCGLVGAWVAGRLPQRHLRPQSGLVRIVALLGIYSVYVLLTDAMGFVNNRPYQYLLAAFLGLNLVIFLVKTLRPDRTESAAESGANLATNARPTSDSTPGA